MTRTMRREKGTSARLYQMPRKTGAFESVKAFYQEYEICTLCGCAVLASLASLYLLRASQPILHGRYPYLPLWPAIILSIRYWGTVPSLLATAVGLLGIDYWFLAPYNSFSVDDPADIAGIAGFLVGAGFLIVSSRSDESFREGIRDSVRTARSAMQSLVAAYADTACRCGNRRRRGTLGHQTDCLAHPSTPVIMGAERSIKLLSMIEEEVGEPS